MEYQMKISVACLLLSTSLCSTAVAQTSTFGTIGVTGDEAGSHGAFGSLSLTFPDNNWLSGSVGVNRANSGFADSRSLSAALDYGLDFDTWSVSLGAGLGDRDDFESRQLRLGFNLQPDNWSLGLRLETNHIDSTIDIQGLTRRISVQNDSSFTGAGMNLAYYSGEGLFFSGAYMRYDEPDGARFPDINQLATRLLNSEVSRLLADNRIDRARLQYRLDQSYIGSVSSSTSVLSDSLSLSLGYKFATREIGFDYYHDTSALFDTELDSYSLRWLFPFGASGKWLEIWAGLSESQGEKIGFGGVRLLLGN